MGSHRRQRNGRRSVPRLRTRSRLLAALAAAVGLTLAAGVVVDLSTGGPVAGIFAASEDPSSSAHAGAAGHDGHAAAAKIVPGVHLARHVPTAAELDATFAKRGLERVDGSADEETSFRVSSFNVLGAIHTSAKHTAHPHWPSGTSRIGRAVGLLRSYDISVVGMQELEVPQYRAFLGATGGGWGVYPGDSLGSQPTDNSIAWRKSDWTLVTAETTDIPYYGPDIPMPHVLLRNTHTGREVWFANYHNASNDHGNAQGKRDAAVRIEAALVKQLSADGTPVIETGDFNDRQRAACPMMTLADMHASDGAAISGGSCSVPMRPYPTVDWVFGTHQVSFSGHVADWSTRDREISDHEMIRTDVSVAPRTGDQGCLSRQVGTVHPRKLWWCPR